MFDGSRAKVLSRYLGEAGRCELDLKTIVKSPGGMKGLNLIESLLLIVLKFSCRFWLLERFLEQNP
jgi:hypothetical protein